MGDDRDTGSSVKALVASGDTFVTIATALENIGEKIDKNEAAARSELEIWASMLFYMQRYYTVAAKKPDHRGGIY